jgi:hypothetical protein
MQRGDGSLTFYLLHMALEGGKQSNRIPAPPAGHSLWRVLSFVGTPPYKNDNQTEKMIQETLDSIELQSPMAS